MNQGAPVQVISIKEHRRRPVFELHESALRQVLFQEDVRDLPAVVVSVVGKMRQGKSYLMNLLIRYLMHKVSGENDNWLGKESVHLEGFEYKSGPQFCTSGILLWSKVFVLHDAQGKKVAVLLMDTQGTFDTATTMKHCCTVFALSTMVSSLQIYNVMMDLKRDDLDSLQLFVAHSKVAQSRDSDVRPFKRLSFLVRDWQWSDTYPYGANGGDEFLQTKVDAGHDIRASFEEVSCFLLPHPWAQMEASGRVDGDITGLSNTFKHLVEDYFAQMLSPDKLAMMIKETAGETIKTTDFLLHFKAFVQVFQGNKVPTPKSAFEANSHVTLTKAYEMGLNTFESIKKSLIGSSSDEKTTHDPKLLHKTLVQCREHAIHKFESRAFMAADTRLAAKYRHRLQQDMEVICQSIEQLNSVRMTNQDVRKALEEAEKYRQESEAQQEEEKKLLKELKKRKKEAEQRKRKMEKSKKKAEEDLLALEREMDERLWEAECRLREAEQTSRGTGRANIARVARMVGDVVLSAVGMINPVAAIVSHMVKPILDAAFPTTNNCQNMETDHRPPPHSYPIFPQAQTKHTDNTYYPINRPHSKEDST